MKLKGGVETQDPRLDRVPQFDERSRNFRAAAGFEAAPLRSYTWNKNVWLDQGTEGACVGFSLAHELAARPVVAEVSETLARRIYKDAQLIDEWPGEDYSGTSVLAGTKVCKDAGYFSSYSWAFSEQELAIAIGYKGPAVLGIDWHTGMYDTDADGYIHPTGDIAGGHSILCDSFNVRLGRYRLSNSWGRGWGREGYCYLTREAMAQLLSQRGEAMIPVRSKV